MALEAAPKDGIYLCYISSGGTADGYFGIFLKSNGNILSVNERVNEAYPGAHKNSRNGRWTENKKFMLFPYAYMVSFSDYDYKGYAAKQVIDTEKLAFFNLGANAYMPLILSMVLVNSRYSDKDVSDMPLMLVDSLLAINVNAALPGVQALAIPKNSELAAANAGFRVTMTAQEVLDSAYSEHFNSSKGKPYFETGDFPSMKENSDAKLFIELYGDGFELDPDALLEANTHLKCLPSAALAEDQTPNAEFVGSEERMTLIAYANARKLLAEHIRDNMLKEYLSYGGRAAVNRWYGDLLTASRNRLYELCAAKYREVQAGNENNFPDSIDASENPLRFLAFEETKSGYPGFSYQKAPFNSRKLDKYFLPSRKFLCPITGAAASVFFRFRFQTWRELSFVFGEESIPKIVKGWNAGGHSISGNPILDVTDAVTGVGTPFEGREFSINRRLWTKDNWMRYYWENHVFEEEKQVIPKNVLPVSPLYTFDLAIGFSKRGLDQLLKKQNSTGAVGREGPAQNGASTQNLPV